MPPCPVAHRVSLRKGFTLIEMSIVLLIIAFIIGGIIGGQEMIKAARLQRVGKEAYEIRDAVAIFQDKYQGLPGDLANANSLWANSGCTDTADHTNPCSGDGSGTIRFNKSILAYTAANGQEIPRFWQHLNLAQMFPGNYTGLLDGGFVAGVNMPSAPLDGTYWQVSWRTAFIQAGAGGTWIRGQYSSIGNMVALESPLGGLLAVDAKAIDSKLDDGIAYTGRIFSAATGDNMACPKYDNLTPFDYITTMNSRDCVLRFNIIDSQRGAS